MERSAVSVPAQPRLGDQTITLSACAYDFADARFVMVGILEEG